MKRIHNKILAMLLVLALTFSCMPENVYAASHLTTEEADGEMEETVNAEVYFVHVATGKIITMSGTLDQQVDCTNVYDSNNVPENAKMTIYYGVGNWGESDGKEVVNFVNKQNGKSWRVDDDVTQINAYTNPTGWESVRMEPQGDGTIAFISCANARYVSVIDEKLGTIEIKTDEGESVSNNEKFIMYTTTAPKKARKVELSNIAGDSITVSWEGVSECLYSGYEVLYSTEEIGTTTGTTFVDENPNASKYQNYYKIKGANDADVSELSEQGSLEISMFGSGAYVFAPTDSQEEIDAVAAEIFNKQHYSQFGDARYALMFKTGDYTSTGEAIQTGYYTQTLGLGKTPYEVRLANVKTPAALSGNNVTCNFWQGIENVTIADLDDNNDDYFSFQWAVSQAAPARRLNVERKAVFDWWSGWASGGYFADTYFNKAAGSYSQQQYYYRNCQIDGGIYGINWQQVVQGCTGITNENSSDNSGKEFANMVDLLSGEGKTNWDQRGYTTIIDETCEIREKPFLYFDEETDTYKVFIPAIRENAKGISWSEDDMGEGTSISVDKYFYVANAEKDTALK